MGTVDILSPAWYTVSMLTKDDISQIGKVVDANNKVLRHEFAEVIEQNVTPQFEAINARLDIIEHKLDRTLYHEIDQHYKWIRQLAAKVGVELARE